MVRRCVKDVSIVRPARRRWRARERLWAAAVTGALALAATPGLASPPAGVAEAVPVPALVVSVTGSAEPVFLHARDACAPDDIPDAPVRAVRTADGAVRLFASHHVNRSSIGPDLDHQHRDCTVAYQGRGADAPERHDDLAWIAALATEDGRTVHALVHGEFHGDRRPDLCPVGDYRSCWRNSLTYARSTDGGRTFTRPEPPGHVVAALPDPFAAGRGRPTGFFSPSTIVRGPDGSRLTGYWYVLAFTTGLGRQPFGNCLLRTNRLHDPAAWRAWDGRGYTVSLAGPASAGPDGVAVGSDDPAAGTCAPVGVGRLGAPVGSLTLHTPSGRWLAVLAANGGLYAATSIDLVDWTPARLFLPATVLGEELRAGPGPGQATSTGQATPSRVVCVGDSVLAYPGIIDPDSPSPMFATTDDGAWLYVVRIALTPDCRPSMDRDLLRMRVSLR